ncbi:hypothetical protein E2C01_001570 [Portunus trituberculatus]|uniref:Uncharacterized protein n=1 Tax=Portunus trituberculatus TaxID=210409 RepID=A0A5B7CGZ6_PORTR|nr:hypothetical protein [Portunus trituberculatus]
MHSNSPLFLWKTIFSNILHTLPHPDLYMSSCPSIFCHQHQVFIVYLFNAIDYLAYCYWVPSLSSIL